LFVRALAGLFGTLIVMAVVLWVSAGTLDYWQAWVFVGIFGTVGLAITLYLLKNDPALLERRIYAGPAAEKEGAQRVIMSIASLGFIGLLVVAGLDRRAHWSSVPASVAVLGDVLIVLGYAIVFRVFKENSFTSATIEVAEGQRVITTGPYAAVRHPMYAGALIYLVAMPIALASWWAEAVMLVILLALLWRLADEEKLLAKTLPGYAEYRARVKYRLVPFIW
jgi:protein-S-isoprenylcysteine O-methyltransferase Ste14